MSQENVEIVRAAFAAWNAQPGEPDLEEPLGRVFLPRSSV